MCIVSIVLFEMYTINMNNSYNFKTIYDIINLVESISTFDSNKYSSDTMSTAYRIPYDIWLKHVRIGSRQIVIINSVLIEGNISLWNNVVYLSYDRV